MPEFIQVALPVPLRGTFTYSIDTALLGTPQLGARVRVSFGNRVLVGIIVEISHSTTVDEEKIKAVLELLDSEALVPPDLMTLCTWAAAYYHHPLGEVFSTALPQRFREGKAPEFIEHYLLTEEGKGLPENALKRAPTQQTLLNYLLAHDIVSASSLEALGIAKTAVKALKDKGLIGSCHPPVASHEQNLEAVPMPAAHILHEPHKRLNAEQQAAFDAVHYHRFACYLLKGVTGSGKTELYMQMVSRVLHSGAQALVLVPEIGLSPQTIGRFKKRFHVEVAELHSNVAESARAQNWIAAKTGSAKIIIGTRLASLAPFKKLGIIIVDEEHDRSYKQQDGFRYSARDLAVYRAHEHNIPIVLGSATPSLESLLNAYQQKYQLLTLDTRAGNALPPKTRLVDLRQQDISDGLTQTTVEAIHNTLQRGEQVLVFLNRRGFAPALVCHTCGWTADCSHCDMRMTVHAKPRHLRCHHCDRSRRLPERCPNCSGQQLLTTGMGTEQLEQTLKQKFDSVPVIRIDRDSTRNKGSLERLLDAGKEASACIYVGTQMLAKGHHIPKLTLVVIMDADQGLLSSDYRAVEQMGQLITQVSGRAGREEKPGIVEIQSHRPDHPILQTLVEEGFDKFAQGLLETRKNASLPPYSYAAHFRAESKRGELCVEFLSQVKKCLHLQSQQLKLNCRIVGPHPAILEKVNQRYRFNLIIMGESRGSLKACLDAALPWIDQLALAKRTRWSLDVDPVES